MFMKMEVYANESDWAPFKNLCGHLQELFLGLFDLGARLLGSEPSDAHRFELRELQEAGRSKPPFRGLAHLSQ